MGPRPPKGAQPPIFGPCLLRPNGCMNQDRIWHGGGFRWPHCTRWVPCPSPQKGAQPPSFRPMSIVAKRLDGQDATGYGDRPRPRRHSVRWVSASPPPKWGMAPNFWPMSIVAKQLPISATAELLCNLFIERLSYIYIN